MPVGGDPWRRWTRREASDWPADQFRLIKERNKNWEKQVHMPRGKYHGRVLVGYDMVEGETGTGGKDRSVLCS